METSEFLDNLVSKSIAHYIAETLIRIPVNPENPFFSYAYKIKIGGNIDMKRMCFFRSSSHPFWKAKGEKGQME